MIKKIGVKLIQKALSVFDFVLISKKGLEKIKTLEEENRELALMYYFPESASHYIHYKDQSRAQLQQDLLVLMHLNFKKNAFFVEFGATDGVSLSNTWLLEKEFGWKGILAEPAKIWHEELKRNRDSLIELNCVWKKSHEKLIFNEAESISTLQGFGEEDRHSDLRKIGKQYEVETISLLDLLQKHSAPEIIDYLSIDTEGSEYEILKAFDFDRYKFRVITVEHNYTSLREKIFQLLCGKGYRRLPTESSLFDDWYVLDGY